MKDSLDGPYLLGFPMQADLYARAGGATGFSFNLILGARSAARPTNPELIFVASYPADSVGISTKTPRAELG